MTQFAPDTLRGNRFAPSGAGTAARKVTPKASIDADVLKAQNQLILKGYAIKADGVMGPETTAAMKDLLKSDSPWTTAKKVWKGIPGPSLGESLERSNQELTHPVRAIKQDYNEDLPHALSYLGWDSPTLEEGLKEDDWGKSLKGFLGKSLYNDPQDIFTNPKVAGEALALPFAWGRGTRGAVAGGKALLKGVGPREAARVARTTYKTSRPIIDTWRGAKDIVTPEKKLPVRTIQTPHGSFDIPASRAKTGRLIEDFVNNHLTPNKVKDMNIGFEASRSLKTHVNLQSVPAHELARMTGLGRRFSKTDEYAIRLMRENSSPEEAIAHHTLLGLRSEGTQRAYHAIHAELARLVQRRGYLSQLPSGEVEFTKGAPDRIKQVNAAMDRVIGKREDLYLDMTRLHDEQIMYRANRPHQIRRGARWQTKAKTLQDALEASEPRAISHASLDKMVPDGPQNSGIKELLDNIAWGEHPENPARFYDDVERVQSILAAHPGTQGRLFQGRSSLSLDGPQGRIPFLVWKDEAGTTQWRMGPQGGQHNDIRIAKDIKKIAHQGQVNFANGQWQTQMPHAFWGDMSSSAIEREAYSIVDPELGERYFQHDPERLFGPEGDGRQASKGDAIREVLPDDISMTTKKATELAKKILAEHKAPRSLGEEKEIATVIQRFYNMAVRGQANRTWYNRGAEGLAAMAVAHNTTPEKVIRLAAVYSQRKSPSGSVPFVLRALQDWDAKGVVETGMKDQRVKANAIMRGEAPFTGPKTNSYSHNILSSLLGHPDDRATIDSWMKRVAKPGSGDSVSKLEYNIIQEIVREVAGHLGWEPKEAQAAIWMIAKAEGLLAENPAWSPEKALFEAADAYEAGIARHGVQQKLDLEKADKIPQNIEGPATANLKGQEFTDFFTAATTGKHAPKVKPEWTFADPEHQAFHETSLKHYGDFDVHIEASIPDYRGKEVRKGVALTKAFPGARVLDIGASEGTWGKALSEQGMETVSLDPNEAMHASWLKTEVPGASFSQETIGPGFDDFKQHTDYGSYDVVNESMTFQFISNDRRGQVKEVKKMLRPGGLAIFDEKVLGPQWAKNESLKDKWKSQFFTTKQQRAKNKIVKFQGDPSSGMMLNMVRGDHLDKVLNENFATVKPYWKQGNFVGYLASDDPRVIDLFLKHYDYKDIPKTQLGAGSPARLVDANPKAAWDLTVKNFAMKGSRGQPTVIHLKQSEEALLDWAENNATHPEAEEILRMHTDAVEGSNAPDPNTLWQSMGDADPRWSDMEHDEFAVFASNKVYDTDDPGEVMALIDEIDHRLETMPHMDAEGEVNPDLRGMTATRDEAGARLEQLVNERLIRRGENPLETSAATPEEEMLNPTVSPITWQMRGYPLDWRQDELFMSPGDRATLDDIRNALPEDFAQKGGPQKGGSLDFPSAYGIKGAISFGQRGATFSWTRFSDISTAGHEWAHFWLKYGDWTPGDQVRIIRGAGIMPTRVKGKTTHPKKSFDQLDPQEMNDVQEFFAEQVEGMISTGRTKSPGMTRAMDSLAKGMLEVYGHGGLPDVTPQMAKILDRKILHGEARPQGSHFVGPDDIRPNSNYTPGVKGYPLAFDATSRALGGYIRASLFSGGRGRAIGEGIQDKALTNTFKGSGYMTGYMKPDVVGPTVDSGMVAAKVSGAAWMRTHVLLPNSTDIPMRVDDYAIIVDPNLAGGKQGTQTREGLKRTWHRLSILEGEGKIHKDDLNGLELGEVIAALTHLIPKELEGEDITKIAAGLRNGDIRPIPNVRWVNKTIADSSGVMSVGVADKYRNSMLVKLAAGPGLFTADVINDFVKGLILFMSPAYIPVNLASNLVLNLVQQGAFMPSNLLRSTMIHSEILPENRRFIDTDMGGGFTSTLTLRSRPGAILNHTIGALATAMVDILPRRASWLQEARTEGFRTQKEINSLIDAAKAGDQKAIDHVDSIGRRAREAIIDYDRLSSYEKDVLTRIIFFYPWVKGSTRWSRKFIIDHPTQAVILALLAEHAHEAQQEQFGDQPQWAKWQVPISTSSVGLGPVGLEDVVGEHTWTDGPTGLPMEMNLQQLLPMTTILQIADAGIGFVGSGIPGPTGDKYSAKSSGALLANAVPVLGAGLTALTGYDSFQHKEVDGGLGTFIEQLIGPESIPIWSKVRKVMMDDEARAKKNKNALNPRSRSQEAWRIGFGAITPAPYNAKAGKLSAAYETGNTLKVEERELTNDWDTTYHEAVPERLMEELEWRVKIDAATEGLDTDQERALAAARLYAEKYGDTTIVETVENLPPGSDVHGLYLNLRHQLYPTLNRELLVMGKLAESQAAGG